MRWTRLSASVAHGRMREIGHILTQNQYTAFVIHCANGETPAGPTPGYLRAAGVPRSGPSISRRLSRDRNMHTASEMGHDGRKCHRLCLVILQPWAHTRPEISTGRRTACPFILQPWGKPDEKSLSLDGALRASSSVNIGHHETRSLLYWAAHCVPPSSSSTSSHSDWKRGSLDFAPIFKNKCQ